ncbi:MAG: hypothetical protein IJ597_01160 [Synergistaceae bacterium]|nr:hypothetical protein [Synergistaceae bacterium]
MKIIFALLILFCINENPGYAHGVGYREISLKSLPLEFFYSTGEKMSYCEAKIFSPNDSKFAAQTSRTDEQGRVAFIPDVIGEWRVIVSDGQGHQCEAKIEITEEFLKNQNKIADTEQNHENDSPVGFELFIRALLGVSLIFNFAFLIKKYYAH